MAKVVRECAQGPSSRALLFSAFAASLLVAACEPKEKPEATGKPAAKVAEESPYLSREESVAALQAALAHPETTMIIKVFPFTSEEEGVSAGKHLPSALWRLKRLKTLYISCFEGLEALPEEVGNLALLEALIIDNGNGCSMNISLPRRLEDLKALRVLWLYGTLDASSFSNEDPRSVPKPLLLPNLPNLQELDLGRNGLQDVPADITRLSGLRSLGLSFNDLDSIPDFVGKLPRLRFLDVRSNNHVRLPQSLALRDSLEVLMGNNTLTLQDQETLRRDFPKATFDFQNEFDASDSNE
jgi:Leucine-rich repeat (LRR) protein